MVRYEPRVVEVTLSAVWAASDTVVILSSGVPAADAPAPFSRVGATSVSVVVTSSRVPVVKSSA